MPIRNTRSKNATATRNDILSAATEEFSRHGFHGARMDRIAKKISASKRMIYYYFKSKEILYRIVLENSYEALFLKTNGIDFDAICPLEAIQKLIAIIMNEDYARPEFVSLIINENLGDATRIKTRLKKNSYAKSYAGIITAKLEKVLLRGQEGGHFRKDLAAAEVLMVISALSTFRVANRYTFNSMPNCDLLSPKIQGRLMEVVKDTVFRLLAG